MKRYLFPVLLLMTFALGGGCGDSRQDYIPPPDTKPPPEVKPVPLGGGQPASVRPEKKPANQ
ncbi:MAG TPA: hypothetical protein VNK04_01390 [Gemmataceae bacterium]|nr:hypothetical protein [Gemmataceae bacterium]